MVTEHKMPLHCMLPAWLFIMLQATLAPRQAQSWTAYDPTAYSECLCKPSALLYDGGIVTNPDFKDGLNGWSPFGSCVLQLRSSAHADDDGNTFVVATNRTASYNGPSQLLANLTSGVKYSVSAWLQVSGPTSTAVVKATVVTESGKEYVCAGTVIAQSGCWSFLKGGFVLDYTPTTSSRLYFETINFTSGMELWLDRASVQPFSNEEWLSHQKTRRESLRRRTVSLQVVDSMSKRVRDANIQVVGTKLGFKFGSAIAQNILSNQQYQKWFLERFNTAVFENELKWYSTERQQGWVNYNTSDAMLAFCEGHNLSVRGHNVVWEDPKFQQQWVKGLGRPAELRRAAMVRVSSVVGRYAGRFMHWDVSNEQLHFSFFEDALGNLNASTDFFMAAQALDPAAQLFVNDYNTLENCNDAASSPDNYIAKLRQLHAAGVANLGIGLEAHFTKPDVAYMRGTLDKLATLGYPIWLTELDINVQALSNNITKAAAYLEEVLLEGFSHPAIAGIVLWTAWHPSGCYRMCLTDSNMINLATGNVIDSLLQEWQQVEIMAHRGSTTRWRGPVGDHTLSVRWRNATYSATVTVSAGKGIQRLLMRLPAVNATANPPPTVLLLQDTRRRHPPQALLPSPISNK